MLEAHWVFVLIVVSSICCYFIGLRSGQIRERTKIVEKKEKFKIGTEVILTTVDGDDNVCVYKNEQLQMPTCFLAKRTKAMIIGRFKIDLDGDFYDAFEIETKRKGKIITGWVPNAAVILRK